MSQFFKKIIQFFKNLFIRNVKPIVYAETKVGTETQKLKKNYFKFLHNRAYRKVPTIDLKYRTKKYF